MKRVAVAAVVLLVVVAAAAVAHGGWAVVSIRNAPDYLVVGRPNELTVEIRGHGRAPLSGVQTSVEAWSGARRVTGRSWETPTTGVYRASLAIPSPGHWKVRIRTNFGRSRAETLPWRAVRDGEQVAPLPDAERGRQLFASRGCVSCHVHSAVDVEGEAATTGPDLSESRLAANYVTRFLADPSIKPPGKPGMQMPNLGLEPREIRALVAFLTTEEVLGKRD